MEDTATIKLEVYDELKKESYILKEVYDSIDEYYEENGCKKIKGKGFYFSKTTAIKINKEEFLRALGYNKDISIEIR